MGRPPGRDSAETRAAIVRAARAQFAQVGYERATNRDIAAGAGVTAGAIYKHFASKAELFVAVVAADSDALRAEFEVLSEQAPSVRAALSAMIKRQLGGTASGEQARFLATVPLEMQRHPELAERLVQQPGSFFELVIRTVERGVHAGEIAAPDAEAVLAMFIAASIGLSVHSTVIGGAHSRAAVEGMVALFEGTLFRGAGPRR